MRRKFFLRCTKPLHKEKTCKQEPARRKLKKNLRSKTEPRRGEIPLSIKQKKCSVIKTEHFFVIGGAEGACRVIKMSGGHFLPASISYC